MITAQQIKELRDQTGAGVSDIKKALEEAGGDRSKALVLIERRLGASASKKQMRETKTGLVESYIHSNGRLGALVEVFCETDFVARTSAFKAFAHDVAMHIAAMRPLYLSFDTIPADIWQGEKELVARETEGLSKPRHIADEIIDGKLKTRFGAVTLLEQPFVKDQEKMVGAVLNEAIGKFGENIKIGRFVRMEM